MVLQWTEGLICLVSGLLFLASTLRIRELAREKPVMVKRAAAASASLWALAAAGCFLLAAADAVALMGWNAAGDVARSASALAWGVAIIPLFYLYGYLILRDPRDAHLAGSVGALILVAASLAFFRAPREVVEVADGYRIQVVRDALARGVIFAVVFLAGAIITFFLLRITRGMAGLGRWRGFVATFALDTFVVSMLVRLAWQDLPSTLASRFILLAASLLLAWAYYLPPRRFLKTPSAPTP